MNYLRSGLRVSLVVAVISTFASFAQAQATRTWVSGVGDDVNPCSRTAPCKTFAGAISKTAMGGVINAVDSGGFGAVTISKSITIDGTGVLAGILGAMTNGISINITDPKDTAKAVRIRGLTIDGVGTGVQGINVVAANSVTIEDTVIDGFTKNGINAVAGDVYITNTAIRNNGVGINTRAPAQVAVSDSWIIFNSMGVSGTIKQIQNVAMYGNKT
ncbi:MAG: hypothetical protein ABI923_02475 [bacterium]